MPGPLGDIKLRSRTAKPRSIGYTAVTDNGPGGGAWMGSRGAQDLVEIAHPYIDAAKMRVALLFLLPQDWVVERVALYRSHGIFTYPGGALFEIAYLQDRFDQMLKGVRELGFDGIEISENFITLDPRQRESLAKRTLDAGLQVIYEWGRKWPERHLDVPMAADEINQMIGFGAKRVVLERGEMEILKAEAEGDLKRLVDQVGMENVALEVGPGNFPEYPVWVIKLFGPEVNMSNVLPAEILRVEEYRRGMDRQVGYEFITGGARL